ncbi:MAG: LamG-like jellyroll fold domain-containing protein [Planctomycetota bacterium]
MCSQLIHLFRGLMKKNCLDLEVWKMCSSSVKGRDVFKGSLFTILLAAVCYVLLGTPSTCGGASGRYALEFDGQDDYVATNEQYLFIYETGEFSASAWIHVYEHAVSNATWNSVLGTGHAGPFRVAVIQDGLIRCTYDGASRVNLYSDPIPVNQWRHVLVQGDGSTLQLYIDGALVDDVAIVPQASAKRPNFAIGSRPDSLGTRVMNGIIDDVRLWNRPLSQEEIQQALDQAVGGDEVGLVGYWTFDEGQGDTAFDSSPTQNHGTITGATWTSNTAPMAPPVNAFAPDPADGALDVPRDVTLSWSPGSSAITHDVYLGTVFADVNGASRAEPRDVLVEEAHTATTYAPAGALQFGQTYYWRIDERDAVETYTGDVWSFTLEPAGYPLPSQRISQRPHRVQAVQTSKLRRPSMVPAWMPMTCTRSSLPTCGSVTPLIRTSRGSSMRLTRPRNLRWNLMDRAIM